MESAAVFLACDVGTGSVRVALFNETGKLLGLHVTPIENYRLSNGNNDIYEQNSDEIWLAFKTSAEIACESAKVRLHNFNIKGCCVDATCSLAFADFDGLPVTLSTGATNNVIMWLDHRAGKETLEMNSKRHAALDSYGGGFSIEMEPPKLLWAKRNLPEAWEKSSIVHDLADFITFKLTGSPNVRSLNTVTCKWAFDAPNNSFRPEFWKLVDLKDAYDRFLSADTVIAPGEAVSLQAKQSTVSEISLPLSPDMAVSAGVVDAYAGALGCLATKILLDKDVCTIKPVEMGAMICGTSTCLFLFAEKAPPLVPGVWGPFYNVLGNGLWAYEAGQSVAGKLLDFIFEYHPAGRSLACANGERWRLINEHLNNMAKERNLSSCQLLTKSLHVCPDFHGNRAPLARPDFRGMICGLDLDTSFDSLALLYLSTVQALAYNVRFMLERMRDCGVTLPRVMVACGGLAKDGFYLQTHATVLKMPFAVSQCSEVVLLGCAILGAAASRHYSSVDEAIQGMSQGCENLVIPEQGLDDFHDKKYAVYRKLLRDQDEILSIMK